MKFFQHLLHQPFITATGAAALVHSTWSLGTFFAGEQPTGWHIVGWLVPALLIAFALDVGQIGTSIQIREKGLTIARATTFIVFSIATYYLQWLYMAHHMPALQLSLGISAAHQQAALALRDLAIWVIPLLLPLSTLLYTFSSDESEHPESSHDDEITITTDWMREVDVSLLPQGDLPALPIGDDYDSLEIAETLFYVETCDDCGWQSGEKDSPENARRALATHKNLHCEVVSRD